MIDWKKILGDTPYEELTQAEKTVRTRMKNKNLKTKEDHLEYMRSIAKGNKHKRYFSDPDKAREAGDKGKKSRYNRS